jgi:hypothetical protein
VYRAIVLLLLALPAYGHEMVPTYPKLSPSHVTGVMKTSLELFNKRQDVEFYDIGVFTEDWQPIPFVSAYRVAHVRYLGHLKFDVYIRKADADRATYICSQSKLRGDGSGTLLASRICSKLHH